MTAEADLTLNKDEVLVSAKHEIVIALEPEQLLRYKELKPFLVEISRNLPMFDNQVQAYFAKSGRETDFPHDLVVVYFTDKEVRLDYWSREVNSQFDMIFELKDLHWELKPRSKKAEGGYC